MSVVLDGAGGVSKTTAGTVTLSSANSYAGNAGITGRARWRYPALARSAIS